METDLTQFSCQQQSWLLLVGLLSQPKHSILDDNTRDYLLRFLPSKQEKRAIQSLLLLQFSREAYIPLLEFLRDNPGHTETGIGGRWPNDLGVQAGHYRLCRRITPVPTILAYSFQLALTRSKWEKISPMKPLNENVECLHEEKEHREGTLPKNQLPEKIRSE